MSRTIATRAIRGAVLLGIGLVHAYLIWAGDILVTYAVLGFFLFLLRNKPDKTLLRIAAACLIFALALNLALFGLTELSKLEPKGEQNVEESYDESEADYRDQAKREENAFAHGSYAEIMRQRVEDNIMNYIFTLFTGPNVFAMFLLGFYTGRRGIFHNIPDNMPLIRRVWRVGLIVGLIANTVHVLAGELSDPIRLSTLSTLSMWGYVIGGPSFALFYLTSIVRLVQTPAWHRRLSPLAYVGRMALSNYLLQSLICTTLFYNYGFGLFGKLGPAAGLALTVAIYTLQIPLSKAWLSRYRFGPVEWLWRSLTYSRRMPIRQSAS